MVVLAAVVVRNLSLLELTPWGKARTVPIRLKQSRGSAELPPIDPELNPEQQARICWVRINRRFQLVITIVALLFAILICWVVLTIAYVISFEKSCAIPLKRYFWLVTLQLVLDVFRSDIMRFVFHWDPGSNEVRADGLASGLTESPGRARNVSQHGTRAL